MLVSVSEVSAHRHNFQYPGADTRGGGGQGGHGPLGGREVRQLIEGSETYQPEVKPLLAPFCDAGATPNLFGPTPGPNFLDPPLVSAVLISTIVL